MTFSIPRNPNTSENLSILNLLAPLVLQIISLYSAPSSILLKYLKVYTTKPFLSSGIITPNLSERSLARHIILQLIVNVTPYHSHFLRPNFALISKHIFSGSHTLIFFPARTDHIDLYPNSDVLLCIARRIIYQVTPVSCFYGHHINYNFTLLTYYLDVEKVNN